MMKQEFERIAKIDVTNETYTNVIEPMYLATNLSKTEFINLLNLKAFAAPKKKDIKVMIVRDRSGYTKTPNGCYYHIEYVELVDVDIKTGKCVVKALDDEDLTKIAHDGHDLHLGYSFDFDYLQCVDTKRKPIALE